MESVVYSRKAFRELIRLPRHDREGVCTAVERLHRQTSPAVDASETCTGNLRRLQGNITVQTLENEVRLVFQHRGQETVVMAVLGDRPATGREA